MITTALKKIFGSRNDRELKRIGKMVKSINELEADYDALSDDDLRAKTEEFRGRVTAGASLDQLLPEAFADSVALLKNISACLLSALLVMLPNILPE